MPEIPYQLIDINKYKQKDTAKNSEGDILFPLETSRGCPFRCDFCTHSVDHKGWRGISAEKIINDLKDIIDRFRIKKFMFVDENFFSSHKRNKEFISQIRKERLDIRFMATATVNYLNGLSIGFLKQLKEVGLIDPTLSIESGSQRILNLIRKPVKLEQVPRVVNNLKKAGLNCNYTLIIGFPYETIDDTKQTFLLAIKLLLQNKNAKVTIQKLAPMPGTKVLEDCIKKGFKKPKKLEDWINTSTFWESPYQWIDKDIQLFMQRYKYMNGLGVLRSQEIPFHNLLIGFFGRVLRYRINKNYYQFNIEKRLYNLSKKFVNREKLTEL